MTNAVAALASPSSSVVSSDFVIINGLECRVCASSYRLLYVDGTEDVYCLCKAKRASVAAVLAQRRARGPSWDELFARLAATK